MRRRYIVMVDRPSEEQKKEFSAAVKDLGLNWWHWISDTWLLIDPDGKTDVIQIRELAHDSFQNINLLVIELDDDGTETWAGYGPSAEGKSMFHWLSRNWR